MFESSETLRNYFPIDESLCEVRANYNVAPTQEVPVIIQESSKNILDKYHWGLVPFWAEDISIGKRMINARAETVDKKPAYRDAFKKRRCLVPANGYFEWKSLKGSKQPIYLKPVDEQPFAFAGLWEMWYQKGSQGTVFKSFTIITTESCQSVQPIHKRMPVVLKPVSYGRWLSQQNQNIDELMDILTNGIVTEFSSYPVTQRVNIVKNNDSSNIKPLD